MRFRIRADAVFEAEDLAEAFRKLAEHFSEPWADPPCSHLILSGEIAIAPDDQDKRKIPVDELGLSVRARNALYRESIATVDELLQWDKRTFRTLKGVGDAILAEIVRTLAGLGFTLRERAPEGVPLGKRWWRSPPEQGT